MLFHRRATPAFCQASRNMSQIRCFEIYAAANLPTRIFEATISFPASAILLVYAKDLDAWSLLTKVIAGSGNEIVEANDILKQCAFLECILTLAMLISRMKNKLKDIAEFITGIKNST